MTTEFYLPAIINDAQIQPYMLTTDNVTVDLTRKRIVMNIKIKGYLKSNVDWQALDRAYEKAIGMLGFSPEKYEKASSLIGRYKETNEGITMDEFVDIFGRQCMCVNEYMPPPRSRFGSKRAPHEGNTFKSEQYSYDDFVDLASEVDPKEDEEVVLSNDVDPVAAVRTFLATYFFFFLVSVLILKLAL